MYEYIKSVHLFKTPLVALVSHGVRTETDCFKDISDSSSCLLQTYVEKRAGNFLSVVAGGFQTSPATFRATLIENGVGLPNDGCLVDLARHFQQAASVDFPPPLRP